MHLLKSGSSISFISLRPSCKLSSASGRKCSSPSVRANTPNVSVETTSNDLCYFFFTSLFSFYVVDNPTVHHEAQGWDFTEHELSLYIYMSHEFT